MSTYLGKTDRHRLSLVIPCYNEEKRLKVERFNQFLNQSSSVKLIFVNDGSHDGTLAVLQSMCAGSGNAEVLNQKANAGKAEAVRTGMRHALANGNSEFVGFWDADLATPLETVDRFLDVLHRSPQIQMVFGARVKLLGRAVERKESRHYLGRVFATAVSLMLRMPIYDTQCGAKIFRTTDALRGVVAEPFLSKWVFDVEILARYLQVFGGDAHALSAAIYEYPLEAWRDVEGSKVRPHHFLTAFLDIARIRARYLS